ncbi:hypothetical protein DFH06DRAFT_1128111 [Mycena polygramma]|nr:hypothetical protein DFH06DRAFT_1128111 [Mycena polygramma]
MRSDVDILEAILRSLCQTNVPAITPSVIAMGKMFLLSALQPTGQHTGDHVSPAIIEDLVGKNGDEYDSLEDLWDDAVLRTVTQFIGCCCTSNLPYKAADTLRRIGYRYPCVAHPVSQLEFATTVMKLCKAALNSKSHETLVQKILDMPLFQYPDDENFGRPHHHPRFLRKSDTLVSIQAEKQVILAALTCRKGLQWDIFSLKPLSCEVGFDLILALCKTRFPAFPPPPNKARHRYNMNWPRWLTDSEARNTIRTALTSYLEGLSTVGDSPKVVQFVEKLLAELNTSVQEQEPSEIIDVLGEIDPATPSQWVVTAVVRDRICTCTAEASQAFTDAEGGDICSRLPWAKTTNGEEDVV